MQLLHDEVTDKATRHFALAERLQAMNDSSDALLNDLTLDGAFLESARDAGAKFQFIERFTSPVTFDDVRHDELGGFECRITLAARLAFSSAAHLESLSGEAGVDNFRLFVTTKRTMQETTPGA
jgi:hypothetical protein